MNKILWVLCMMLCVTRLSAQTQAPKTTSPTRTVTPQQQQKPGVQPQGKTTTLQPKTVVPPPYVLKKDFEEKMSELAPKINAAINSGASVRKEVSAKLQKLDTLDMRMQEVENILTSANFKISTTSDSLKKAQTSMEEFRKQTETNMKILSSTDEQFKYIWMLLGLSVVSILVVVVMMNNRMKKLRNELQLQSETLRSKLWDEMERQQAEMKSELQSLRGRVQTDMNSMRTQLMDKLNSDSEAMNAQLKQIAQKLNNAK